MAAPNRSDVVIQTDAAYPHLLRTNTHAACAEFLQRCLIAMQDPEWGHVGKSEGENGYTFPNGVRVSHDAIFHRAGYQQVDIINGAGAAPSPGGPAWQEIDPAVYRPSNVWTPQQPLFDSGTSSGGGSLVVADLGISIFPAIRACTEWPSDLLADVEWIEEHLFGAHLGYARVFLDVEGSDHGTPDPWRDAGCNIQAASWSDDYRRMLDFFSARGWRLLCTMYGSPNRAQSRDQHQANLQKFITATEGRWASIVCVETANEWAVNNWDCTTLVEYAQDVRAAVPSQVTVAVSSPHLAHAYTDQGTMATNEEMADSINELYAWATPDQNVHIGVHLMRGDPTAKWADPFAYNGLTPLLLYSGEPCGPGASAGGDVIDPASIVGDYKRAGDALWTRYTQHSAWGVWNGRLPAEYWTPTDVKHVWEHENMQAICNGLRDYRASGTLPDPVAPVGEHMAKHPYPDEATYWATFENECAALYKKAGQDVPAVAFQTGRWFSRTAWDLADALTPDDSADKHLDELAAHLGVSR